MIKKDIIFISFLLGIGFMSCSRDDKGLKKEFYDDGKLHSAVHIDNGVENGVKTYYYKDGSIEGIEHVKDGKLEGGYCYFFENGNVKTVGYYKSGMLQNSNVWYNDSGSAILLGEFTHNTQYAVLPLISNDLKKINPFTSVITHASPFVTLNSISDTIRLGETYSADIILNFYLKDYDCAIYIKDKKTGEYNMLNSGTEATYKETPTELGEHSYDVSVMQVYNKDIPKTSGVPTPVHTNKILFTVKYFVKDVK